MTGRKLAQEPALPLHITCSSICQVSGNLGYTYFKNFVLIINFSAFRRNSRLPAKNVYHMKAFPQDGTPSINVTHKTDPSITTHFTSL